VEKENPQESPERRAENLLSGLERVREAARKNSPERFTALLHHVTVDLLRKAYHKLNPRAVPRVDEVTWKEYGQGLGEAPGGITRPSPQRSLPCQTFQTDLPTEARWEAAADRDSGDGG
jgi:hypothetical protein